MEQTRDEGQTQDDHGAGTTTPTGLATCRTTTTFGIRTEIEILIVLFIFGY